MRVICDHYKTCEFEHWCYHKTEHSERDACNDHCFNIHYDVHCINLKQKLRKDKIKKINQIK